MDRFWDKVNKDGPIHPYNPELGPCWEWIGRMSPNGYGRFKTSGFEHPAHVVSWEMVNGPVPNGLSILHSCDNKPCVNWNHLWSGTLSDNMMDMSSKYRGRDQVQLEIIMVMHVLHRDGNTNRQIARTLHINHVTVGRLLRTVE